MPVKAASHNLSHQSVNGPVTENSPTNYGERLRSRSYHMNIGFNSRRSKSRTGGVQNGGSLTTLNKYNVPASTASIPNMYGDDLAGSANEAPATQPALNGRSVQPPAREGIGRRFIKNVHRRTSKSCEKLAFSNGYVSSALHIPYSGSSGQLGQPVQNGQRRSMLHLDEITPDFTQNPGSSSPTGSTTTAGSQATIDLVQPLISVRRDRTATISSRNSFRIKAGVNLRQSVSETCLGQKGANRSTMLADAEALQVEAMYNSNSSRVIVCRCLANLYFSEEFSSSTKADAKDWELVFTGVPLLLLDHGVSRVRLRRQLSIILAEKGTGFALWRDTINSLSRYTEVERTFHTMLCSTNPRNLIGLSFDNAFAATEFHIRLKELTSDPENVSIRGQELPMSSSGSSTDKRRLYRRHSFSGNAKRQWLKKVHISTPCCFQHITSIRPSDVTVIEQIGLTTETVQLRMNENGRAPSTDEDFPKRSRSCMQIIGQPVA